MVVLLRVMNTGSVTMRRAENVSIICVKLWRILLLQVRPVMKTAYKCHLRLMLIHADCTTSCDMQEQYVIEDASAAED